MGGSPRARMKPCHPTAVPLRTPDSEDADEGAVRPSIPSRTPPVNPPSTKTTPGSAARPPQATPLSVRSLRQARPLHRWVGVPLTVLVLLSSLTGVLLGWKKNSATLQPPTQAGASTDLGDWRSLAEVHDVAVSALAAHPGRPEGPLEVDRFDARPADGIVKVIFTEGAWEVQVDPTSLRALSVARRHSDWIETVHDLSIVGDGVKLLSMNVLGIGLIVLSLSGLWLWYGPRWVRRQRQ